jgi:branched-chain amino acid transport system substrate-binding protein
MDENKATSKVSSLPISRRALLSGAGSLAGAAALAMPSIARAESKTLKIGFIAPLSGIRSAFGASTSFTLDEARRTFKDGIVIRGEKYAVELIVKDNQSSPTRSLQIGNELILNDKPDIILSAEAEAATAIGNLCDARGMPTLSTDGPWQGWAFQRHYNPAVGFPFTFHFFWGADELGRIYTSMWDSVLTNKKVGTLYADNDGGRATSDKEHGFPPAFTAAGYTIVDTGLFRSDNDDFSTQITTFKAAGVDIVSGLAFQNHMVTFWNQAAQAGFKPKICTVAAAFLFPSGVDNLGARGDGMSTEVWWSPAFPFKSSLTGQTARELADGYMAATGKQWTQPLGYDHALIEVGVAALKNAADPKSHEAVRDALKAMKMDTVVGTVDFASSPLKNVAVTHTVGGQWQKAKSGAYKFDLAVVNNSTNPAVPVASSLLPLAY